MNNDIIETLEKIGSAVVGLAAVAEKGDLPGHPFRGNQYGGGGGGSGTHTVPLPKNPKKLNMDTAASAMRQMGFEMKPAGFNMQTQQAEYKVTDRSGNERRMTSREVRDAVYAGAEKR